MTAIELAQIAVEAEDGNAATVGNSNERRAGKLTHNRNRPSGISKQEMCHQLDAIRQRKDDVSPKRLQRLYALL